MRDGRTYGGAGALAGLLALAVVAGSMLVAPAAGAGSSGSVGAEPSRFPAAGSYQLGRIGRFPDLALTGGDGRRTSIREVTGGRITMLAFFYSYCRDPDGCPAAWSAFDSTLEAIRARPDLHGKVRFVFVGLDPENDTPATMGLFETGRAESRPIVPWHFLTAKSYRDLLPFLEQVGQDIGFEKDETGGRGRTITHMLKVFLFDPDGWIREIYTTAFLNPEAMFNDIRTLAMEPRVAAAPATGEPRWPAWLFGWFDGGGGAARFEAR